MKSLIFSFLFLHIFSVIHASINLPAPALYVFGDSLVDSGNNNLLPTLAKGDFLPYGIDFVDGATGRFTNGRTVADFIAEFLGLPYSPPYLSLRALTTTSGVNYASGACGILPKTGIFSGKCLNLGDQVSLFNMTVRELSRQDSISPNELSDYLSKSLFIFSIGSNDYMGNYLRPESFITSKRFTPPQFAQFLLDSLAEQFQRLYSLGARKMLMFEIGPIGCIPSRTRKHGGRCVEEMNQLVSLFNTRLGSMLNNLTTTLKGSTFVHAKAYWLAYDAIKNPRTYGLIDVANPCCITFNGTTGCIPLLPPCSSHSTHYFWDAYHLSEATCSIIASRCFNDTSVCSPYTIQQLVRL